MNQIEALVESLTLANDGASFIRAGVDRVELDEFQRTIDAAGQPFLNRVFTALRLDPWVGDAHVLPGRGGQ